MSEAGPGGVEPPHSPLRKNKNFQLLWSGTAFTLLANEIGLVAFPLIILGLTGSPATAGVYAGVQLAASVCVGVPAGAWVDRHDRWRLVLAAEATKCVTLLVLALVLASGRTQTWHLMLVAAVLGSVAPFAGSARMLMVRKAVPVEQLTSALTQDEIRGSTVSLSGPSLAGWVYSWGMAVPVLLASALSAISVLLVGLVDRSLGAIDREPASGSSPVVGLQILWRSPVLRLGTIFAAASNLAIAPLMLIVIVILREDDVDSWVIGVTTAGLAVGGLLGTLLVKPAQRLLRPGRLLLVVGTATTVLIGLLAWARQPWLIAGLLALIGVGGPSVRILVDILIFRQVNDEERGRTVTVFMTVLGVGSALGVLVSGFLLELAPWVAVVVLAVVLAAAMCAGYASRAIRAAEWP